MEEDEVENQDWLENSSHSLDSPNFYWTVAKCTPVQGNCSKNFVLVNPPFDQSSGLPKHHSRLLSLYLETPEVGELISLVSWFPELHVSGSAPKLAPWNLKIDEGLVVGVLPFSSLVLLPNCE